MTIHIKSDIGHIHIYENIESINITETHVIIWQVLNGMYHSHPMDKKKIVDIFCEKL